MIKKLWVNFDDMDVKCFCNEHDRKCKDKDCKLYVVKFIEITKEEEENQTIKDLDLAAKKFQKEISNTLRKMKKVKL